MPDNRPDRTPVLAAPHWFATILTAVFLTGCAAASSQTSSQPRTSDSLGQPIATASSVAAPSSTTTASGDQGSGRATRQTPEEPIYLPVPPSPSSPRARAIVAAATEFAQAYLVYQTGRETAALRRATRQTCTPAFATLLLSHPVSIPPAQRNSPAERRAELTQVTYTGPAALGPGAPTQIVIARYRTVGRPSVGGQLTIALRAFGRAWRVIGLE